MLPLWTKSPCLPYLIKKYSSCIFITGHRVLLISCDHFGVKVFQFGPNMTIPLSFSDHFVGGGSQVARYIMITSGEGPQKGPKYDGEIFEMPLVCLLNLVDYTPFLSTKSPKSLCLLQHTILIDRKRMI